MVARVTQIIDGKAVPVNASVAKGVLETTRALVSSLTFKTAMGNELGTQAPAACEDCHNHINQALQQLEPQAELHQPPRQLGHRGNHRAVLMAGIPDGPPHAPSPNSSGQKLPDPHAGHPVQPRTPVAPG